MARTLVSLALVVMASNAAADETTVVAPPDSEGVSVVAPTPNGGKVTASGCAAVTVENTPTVVASGGCVPFKAYAPPPRVIYVIREIYIHGKPPGKPRPPNPDPERTEMIAYSAVGLAVTLLAFGAMYELSRDPRDTFRGAELVPWIPGVLYASSAAFIPGIPRLTRGDAAGFWGFAAATATTVALAALCDRMNQPETHPSPCETLIGVLAVGGLATANLAGTPMRFTAKKAPVDKIAPMPISDPVGRVHGVSLSLGGSF